MKKVTIVALSAFISLASWFASAVELAPNHPEFHVVQPGDTLWDISKMFNGLSIERIKQLNGLNNDKIKPGQKLKIG